RAPSPPPAPPRIPKSAAAGAAVHPSTNEITANEAEPAERWGPIAFPPWTVAAVLLMTSGRARVKHRPRPSSRRSRGCDRPRLVAVLVDTAADEPHHARFSFLI